MMFNKTKACDTSKKSWAIKQVQSVVVESPCTVNWDSMEGDEKKRFCGQCQKNVFMISAMSDEEAAKVLVSNGPGKPRPCVYFYRKEDGTIVTDNCPVILRKQRTRIAAACLTLLLGISWGLAQYAIANDIHTATVAVDPRYGTSNEVGLLADYGYDQARDTVRIVTAFAAVLCFFVPKYKHKGVKQAIVNLATRASVPLLTHLIGTFWINNFGGLGGGL